MRVVNTGEACRITYWMRTDPQRVPYEAAELTRAPSNGTATATGNGVAYTPRPGFAGSDSFTVATRGVWQGAAVNGQVVVTVIVLPRP
ncbi:Ig-like domain-containing protein [Elioraea sp.]|uniref:Ig-like domain-containing protein n=1 Tax=Elioraea sp. TaxID=2185103 RepID=UPI003F713B74